MPLRREQVHDKAANEAEPKACLKWFFVEADHYKRGKVSQVPLGQPWRKEKNGGKGEQEGSDQPEIGQLSTLHESISWLEWLKESGRDPK